MLHGYAHLDSLSTGQLERDGLWVLFELIQFGDFLAQKLIHSLNRDDPAAGPMARYVMEHAADCLANVAARSVVAATSPQAVRKLTGTQPVF